jgi:excisionase family DNA binding protein
MKGLIFMCTGMSNAGRPAYYTVRQAAWILGVKPSTVSRAIRLGTLRAVWWHGQPLVPARALIRLLEASTVNKPQVERLAGGASR